MFEGEIAGNGQETIDINHRIARHREVHSVHHSQIEGRTDVGLDGGITPVELGFTSGCLIERQGAIRDSKSQRIIIQAEAQVGRLDTQPGLIGGIGQAQHLQGARTPHPTRRDTGTDLKLQRQTCRCRAEQGVRGDIKLLEGEIAGNRYQSIDVNNGVTGHREVHGSIQTQIKR